MKRPNNIRASDISVAKDRLLLSASALALLIAATPAIAANSSNATSQTAQAPAPEEIVISGTRIVRDGYEAPTPVSVVGLPDLEETGVTKVADALNRLPEISGSTITTGEAASFGGNTGGANSINLRGLTPQRTLVLLDGKRIVGSNFNGFNNDASAVDINVIPNNLIARVDIVTGGASAVYGSDALAGVVNFVLDKTFTGIKGNVAGNITTYGDDPGYELSLAIGEPFANDKGHVLLSADYYYQAGLEHNNRAWDNQSYSLMANPGYAAGNGQPQYISVFDTGSALSTPGGLITSGPLKGTMFGPGGAPATFAYGSLISGAIMSGGDWQVSRLDNLDSLDTRQQHTTIFTRLSYDISDNITAYTEFGWMYEHSRSLYGVSFFDLGSVTVHSGNPYIPASIQAEMNTMGLTSFSLGTSNADESTGFSPNNARTFRRWMGGFNGKVTAFDTNWTWDVYAQRSMTGVSARVYNDQIPGNYTLATDAVLNPANGQIVCRSTLTNPTNGCVPYDVFGIGVNQKAALQYISSTGFSYVDLTQDVEEGSITGEPFSSWAGPVSVALSAAHRQESTAATSSALDEAQAFFAGNFIASFGKYSVTEGALEVVVPLARNAAWAKSFDLNAAVRATDYTTSGYVTTWKVGATYQPIDDITFRGTQSRDIRAPTLNDLYSAGNSGGTTVIDPAENNAAVFIRQDTLGNINLQPEKADSTGLGAVFQPTFLPGFGASVDWYDVHINGAIVSLNAQTEINLCYEGNTALCGFLGRTPAGVLTTVNVEPANFQVQKEQGIDFESSYTVPLDSLVSSWEGKLSLRGLATYIYNLQTIGNGSTYQGAGVIGGGAGIGNSTGLNSPRWKYILTATYNVNAFEGSLTARGTGSGLQNAQAIQCTSGCPTATPSNPTIDNNHVPGWMAFDIYAAYKVYGDNQVYLTVQNMFNRNPPLIAANAGSAVYAGQNNAAYDQLGRVWRMGVRFKM